jgi:hypothetical protein
VLHDTTGDFRADVLNIAGYASWGSNATGDAGPPFYGRIGGRLYPGTFANRAIASDLVSFSARTFTAPPSYGQSLAADLVRLGAAGVVGNVFEPTLAGVSRPQILLRRYAQGVRAVEAYFRSVPYLGWMNVYVGDPLMVSAHPVPREPADRDGDGVPNAEDNCADQPNADQLDSNGDGFGNLCDADVDNDGVVTTSWGAAPPGDIERIRASAGAGRFVPDHDLNGDGRVDARDVSIAILSAFLPPGPSGLAASEVRPRAPRGSRKSAPARENSDTLSEARPQGPARASPRRPPWHRPAIPAATTRSSIAPARSARRSAGSWSRSIAPPGACCRSGATRTTRSAAATSVPRPTA